MPFGFDGGGPDTGDPSGIFSGIIAAIYDALVWLYNLIVNILLFLWNLLVALVNILVSIFKTIGKFLVNVWNNYIKKGILWLASHIQRLRDWLKRVLKPVLKFFQKLKHWYDTHVLAQQLRVLAMIQKIRRFLGILRLFHIHIFDKLDNALADIQQRIQQSIAFVRGILNEIINTLTLVMDPTLFLKRGVMGGTLLGNLGAVKRIFGYGDGRIASAAEVATLDRDRSRYFKSSVDDHIKTLVSTGLTDEDKTLRDEFRKTLAETTSSTLPPQVSGA